MGAAWILSVCSSFLHCFLRWSLLVTIPFSLRRLNRGTFRMGGGAAAATYNVSLLSLERGPPPGVIALVHSVRPLFSNSTPSAHYILIIHIQLFMSHLGFCFKSIACTCCILNPTFSITIVGCPLMFFSRATINVASSQTPAWSTDHLSGYAPPPRTRRKFPEFKSLVSSATSFQVLVPNDSRH